MPPYIAGKVFTKDGKPIRVLSTSLGFALLANALIGFAPSAHAAAESASETATPEQPKLVEWTTDAAKGFYDPAVDWNIPSELVYDENGKQLPYDEAVGTTTSGSGAASSGGSGNTTIIHTGGLGWDDLLLYHLIFNNGRSYYAQDWHRSHKSSYTKSGKSYRPDYSKYNKERFQNKPVVGSSVRPKTTNETGKITRRSTSSSKGSMGGKSSSLSSSGSSKSSSSSGFGG
ncbi:hypothetical protein GOM71_22790 [Paenibacillus sp. NEAU-GSW1]|nr:hypothetical protein [Paenibacillus sp. NEAU-GSW1]